MFWAVTYLLIGGCTLLTSYRGFSRGPRRAWLIIDIGIVVLWPAFWVLVAVTGLTE